MENCKLAESPVLNDLDFLAADFELIDNINSADLEYFAIMIKMTSRTLLEEANITVRIGNSILKRTEKQEKNFY